MIVPQDLFITSLNEGEEVGSSLDEESTEPTALTGCEFTKILVPPFTL
jgi:hypothetical protein